MYLASKTVRRFSLLLLEEGEDYLYEYVCECTWPTEIEGNKTGKFVLSGTLRLCTKSLFFEADDIRVPVVRLPLSLVHHLEPQQDKSFMITTRGITKMKENNQDQPYIHIRNQESKWTFRLLYANFDVFLGLVTEQMAMKDNEALLLERSQERLDNFHFDTSRLVNFSERIAYTTSVCHLMPLVREQGKMVITDSRLYFQSMSCVSEGADIVLSHPLDFIAAVTRRRCSLKPSGLEVFFVEPTENREQFTNSACWNSPCAFFAFQTNQEREIVVELLFTRIQNWCVPGGILQSEGEWLSCLSTAWQHGRISNFNYLLYLNLASGRTFNDLRQWPVFPWVLSNYKSSCLDIRKSANYRDLSKPVGALNPERLETYRKRYYDMPREEGCPPPFFYGTHYSTPGYVMFWLVRTAPAHMLQLQSGKFDAPDRMFFSIPEAWESINHNQADVKELIPEFFLSNTDFLLNTNHLALGKRQNGQAINDVVLPPWAESPAEFLAINRAALESEYVSKNLHHWINLIFGHAQKGEAAVEANNVFYYLSYEGAVDIEAEKDPLARKALEAQINEFGQTPKQLFKFPHPPRSVIPPTPDPKEFLMSQQSPKEESGEYTFQPVVGSRKASNQALSLALISIVTYIASGKEVSDALPPKPLTVFEKSRTKTSFVSHTSILSSQEKAESLDSRSSAVDLIEKVRKEWSDVDLGSGIKRHSSGNDLRVSMRNTLRGFNSTFSHLVDSFNSRLMLSTKPILGSASLSNGWCHSIPHKMRLRHKLSFLQGTVNSVEMSHLDGGTLYCAGDNATLRMFSLENGNQLRSAKIGKSAGSSIPLSDLDLLPHAKPNFQPLALVGSYDNSVYVYSIEFGRLVGFFDAHDDAVSVVKLMSAKKRSPRLMTTSWDCSMKIWRLTEGKAPWEGQSTHAPIPELHYTDHEAPVFCAAEYADAGLVVSGTSEGVMTLFDIRCQSPVWKTHHSEAAVGSICFLPDGEHLTASYDDGTIKLISMKMKGEAMVSAQCSLNSSCCTSDGLMSVHGMSNGQIYIWNIGQFLGKASTVPDQPVPDEDGFFLPLQCSTNSRVNSLSVKSITGFDGSEALWIVSGQDDGTINILSSPQTNQS